MSASSTSVHDDLVPMDGAEPEPVGFDVVRFGGYDRRQVDDYLDRVDEHITALDDRHAQDRAAITSLQSDLAELRDRLDDAEKRASGQPEPRPGSPSGSRRCCGSPSRRRPRCASPRSRRPRSSWARLGSRRRTRRAS
jgi:DivIVA domain-containing protein